MNITQQHKLRLNQIFFIGTLLVTAVLFYLYNANTPLYADDYSYAVSFYDHERITSIWDIPSSLFVHYFTMNGRLVTHCLAHFYLMYDECFFDIVNTFVFLGLGLLMYRISGFSFQMPRPWALATIFMLLFWQTPDFGESYLWTDAAATYLHGVVILLLFFLPYWNAFRFPEAATCSKTKSRCFAFLYLIFGILAGDVSETNSLAILVMIAILLVIAFYRKQLRGWMITGFFGCLAGYLFMLAAPGNAARIAYAGITPSLSVYLTAFDSMTWKLIVHLRPLIGLGILLVLLLLLSCRKQPLKEVFSVFLPVLIFLLGTGASYYSGIAAGSLPLRAYNGVAIFGIVSCGCILSQLRLPHPILKHAVRVALAAAVLLTFQSYYTNLLALRDVRQQFDDREASIRQQMEAGETDIYIPRLTSECKYSVFWEYNGDIVADAAYWTNTSIARYWNVGSINMIP